jgi:hypothetical protein
MISFRLGTIPNLHLHARVFHCEGPPGTTWYVDVDDLDDPQPDDPYWYGYFATQPAAMDAACCLLRVLAHDPLLYQHLTRVSQRISVPSATTAA